MANLQTPSPDDDGGLVSLPGYVDANRLFGRHGFRALDWYARVLMDGFEVRGGRALEIGAGDGILSLWLLWAGARAVVSLEPEAAGSTAGVAQAAARRQRELHLTETRWQYRGETLQEFTEHSDGRLFHLVLSHDSVNHLDEAACLRLPHDPAARRTYIQLFRRIRDLLVPGGRFVLSDAARVNYWDRLGLQNPLSPTIEWRKHLEPEDWCDLITEAGLRPLGFRWFHPYYRYRALDPLLRRRPIARALGSYFVLGAGRV